MSSTIQRSDVGDQMAEDGGRRTEVRGQRAEDGRRRAEGGGRRAGRQKSDNRESGSKPKAVVILMCADPEPGDDVTFANADSAVVVTDSHDTDSVAPFFESKRGMMRVLLPERVFLVRQLLHRDG